MEIIHLAAAEKHNVWEFPISLFRIAGDKTTATDRFLNIFNAVDVATGAGTPVFSQTVHGSDRIEIDFPRGIDLNALTIALSSDATNYTSPTDAGLKISVLVDRRKPSFFLSSAGSLSAYDADSKLSIPVASRRFWSLWAKNASGADGFIQIHQDSPSASDVPLHAFPSGGESDDPTALANGEEMTISFGTDGAFLNNGDSAIVVAASTTKWTYTAPSTHQFYFFARYETA